MKTATIKRGSIVKTRVPVKLYGDKFNPAGTLAQVTRVRRKTNQVLIHFKSGSSGYFVPLADVEVAEQTNQQVPKVGDIFAGDWGYEQTQTNWFKVVYVSPSGKSIKTVNLQENRVYEGPMHGKATVDVNVVTSEPVLRKLNYNLEGNASFKWASYGTATLVDKNASRFFSEWY
jgi:hypothetical protein